MAPFVARMQIEESKIRSPTILAGRHAAFDVDQQKPQVPAGSTQHCCDLQGLSCTVQSGMHARQLGTPTKTQAAMSEIPTIDQTASLSKSFAEEVLCPRHRDQEPSALSLPEFHFRRPPNHLRSTGCSSFHGGTSRRSGPKQSS